MGRPIYIANSPSSASNDNCLMLNVSNKNHHDAPPSVFIVGESPATLPHVVVVYGRDAVDEDLLLPAVGRRRRTRAAAARGDGPVDGVATAT